MVFLIFRVVRPRGDGPLPDLAFGAVDLPGQIILLDRAVLQLHVRVRDQVVIPDGVLGTPPSDAEQHGILALVLDTHQRALAQLAGLRSHGGRTITGLPPCSMPSVPPERS